MDKNAIAENYFSLALDNTLDLSLYVSKPVLAFFFVLLIGFGIYRLFIQSNLFRNTLEIDAAEFGVGSNKVTIRPNYLDKQIAYKIWVELSTRKIGLNINLNEDVIVEVYNSWYEFFSITRELIKEIPASKLKRKDTREIIQLSIEILNYGIRPHLTMT